MYQELKAIEVAAFFLRKRPDWEMDYYDLIKLMYLAEREQIKRKGRTITGDELYSLPWGPVVSNALDAVRKEKGLLWAEFIQTDRVLKRSRLVKDAPPAKLSRGEMAVLEAIWKEFGAMNGEQLMHYTHKLPEYTDTDSRVLISLEDVARAVGFSDDWVETILEADLERNQLRRFKDHLTKVAEHAAGG